MKSNIIHSDFEQKHCPYCNHKLSFMAYTKRRVLKNCTCKHCHKTIAERHKV